MNVFEAIESRRAVKAFDPEHEMPADDFKKLMHAGRLAPTAFNIQHTRFLVVRDPELRKKIRDVSWDQSQVTDASVLIIVCADEKAWEKDPARYWRHAAQPVQDFMVPTIKDYYGNREMAQRDETMRSCGLAAQNLMLAAKGLGYDSCPMDGFDFDAVADMINLPDDHVISMFVTVGKGIKEPNPRSGPIEEDEQILFDRF
jgi:nitroreductase